ncbi:MAG: four helix bundle protein [Bacteroidia bacterium]|nr:four helix bundle protein [Bacteroidia bacterium]
MGNYKDLKVWQQSKDLAVDIYRLTDQGLFIKDFGLRDQMRRSSVSVSSNIAEGDDLDTDKQSIRHFYIARGSIAELRTQLVISMEIEYISSEKYKELEKICDNISAMLTGLIRHRSK